MVSREREWAGLGRLINVLSEARDSSTPDRRRATIMDTSRVQPIKLARVRRKPGFEGPDEGGRSRGTGWSRSDPSFFTPGHQGAGQDRFAGTVHAGELERRGGGGLGGLWGLSLR